MPELRRGGMSPAVLGVRSCYYLKVIEGVVQRMPELRRGGIINKQCGVCVCVGNGGIIVNMS